MMVYNICMAFTTKVSKPGFDVTSETNPNNLILDISKDHLRTSTYGSFSRTISDGSNETVTIAHGLGYKPLVMGYWTNTEDNLLRICFGSELFQLRLSVYSACLIKVDDTNVYFYIANNSGASRSYTVKYEIFYQGEQ